MAIRNDLLSGTDWQDTGSTTLNGALNDAAVTITVVATASFKTTGVIEIEDEFITYTGKTATTFTGCTRGAYDSTAAAHDSGKAVAEKEIILTADVNDTFDAAVDLIQQNPCFWLNSELYDVYDDFNSDTPTDPPDVSKWTITISLDGLGGVTGTGTVVNSQYAGGTTNELRLYLNKTGAGTPTTSYVWGKAIALTANRHTWMRIAYSGLGQYSSANSTTYVSFDNASTSHALCTVSDETHLGISTNSVMVVAKGGDDYDCYVGGKLVQAVTDDTSFEIWLTPTVRYGSFGNSILYIDDVRQSKTDVS